jgi:hypothetical protein
VGPVQVGVRSKCPGPSELRRTWICWVLLSLARSFEDLVTIRSHPNKTVDVAFQNFCSSFARSTHYSLSCIREDSLCIARLALFLAAIGGYAASCAMPAESCRNGSYTSPFIHSRCNNTASFRATATAARFFAFFPPRSQSRSPYRRRSVSGPKGPKIYWALPTNNRRNIISPALLIPSCGWLSPESSCFGTKPRYGPTSVSVS